MRRPARLLATAVAAVAPVLGALAPQVMTTPAAASEQTVNSVHLNGFEAGLAARINDARRAHGLRSLVVVPGATDVARRWAWHLASAQTLSHHPNLVGALERAGSSAWAALEGTVGEGSSPARSSLSQPYMASPPHRANIL